jgi:hypothetical protein
LEQTSIRNEGRVEPTVKVFPQAQVTDALSKYLGWIFSFI